MKAMLKNGKWYDVCTDSIQENGVTILREDGKREFVFDERIIQIRDDVRTQKKLLFCHYCGFTGTEEEFEEHIKKNEEQSHHCESCKYYKFIIDDRNQDVRTSHSSYSYNEDITGNSYTHVSHTVYRTKYIKGCGYCRWAVSDKQNCAYTHCRDTKPLDYSRGFFQQNPYGFLFKKWEYEPENDIIHRKFSNGYNFELNVNTGDVVLYNTRRKFEYNLGITYHYTNGWLHYDVPYQPKTRAEGIVGQVFRQATVMFDEIKRSYECYNDNLDDKYYTNPDGSPMEFAIIDGEKVYRPKPLTYTFGAKEK